MIWLSRVPELLPTTKRMTLLPEEVSLISGSAPIRPTMVMRARCLGLVVVKVLVRFDGRVCAVRRAGLSRKDMVVVDLRW